MVARLMVAIKQIRLATKMVVITKNKYLSDNCDAQEITAKTFTAKLKIQSSTRKTSVSCHPLFDQRFVRFVFLRARAYNGNIFQLLSERKNRLTSA